MARTQDFEEGGEGTQAGVRHCDGLSLTKLYIGKGCENARSTHRNLITGFG